ncbi:hypothetical protein GIB67_005152 [Kingdonia uniflora]|uniref:non-specific serine/threonine protein kinase n=1 Tax=Kingdonia uniflora TaxID=39325 RepID=A0A7J7NND8_9MAGN|nr:hypothetical protein GIB67_005152 [Kingdonia uniflora]
MKKTQFQIRVLTLFCVILASILHYGESQGTSVDTPLMLTLKKSLNPPSNMGWLDSDPCKWDHVGCSNDNRVTRIQIGNQGLTGTLPSGLNGLSELERLELQGNSITGPLPTLNGMSSLQALLLSGNNFSEIPVDLFAGLSSLQVVELDKISFAPWEIPESLRNATTLQNFSANSANIKGNIPDIFGGDSFPSLIELHLAFNKLEGGLPASFSGSTIQSLWLNGQQSTNKLTGTVEVLGNMTSLTEVWLQSNKFLGPLPDFVGLLDLWSLSLRDNQFTGPVPLSLVSLKSLKIVNITNNMLQGPVPKFDASVAVDMSPDTNKFCLPAPGDCDPRVNVLLSVAKDVGYPTTLAERWDGNDPCKPWVGVSCMKGEITVINYPKMNLTGTISPEFASLKSLTRIVLSDNNLYGSIPAELTTLPNLVELDVSNNKLTGPIPSLKGSVKTSGNPDIGKINLPPPPGFPSSGEKGGGGSAPAALPNNSEGKKSSIGVGVIVGSVIGGICALSIIGLLACCFCKRKQHRFVQNPDPMVIHPRNSGSDQDMVKITVASSAANVGGGSEAYSHASSGTSDIQVVEAGNMVISIQVLRHVTNDFHPDNILGRGGFGTVYKGELHDGTKIAVKRMEAGIITEKGLNEFKSEIAVLTKVRHRNLVALLGYCLDGNERLLVYEYMPQGTLSHHLFHWKEEDLKPLEWTRRLSLALDVARGVEYLHGLAHQVFIHRDLKPSNILLGDDMRAKVADFGLVRLAPEGKGSIETRLAGTFGYLAPEYAVTGRVSTKVDVFSFGVILMELISGRRALDESMPEESMHLVTWFRRMQLNKNNLPESIDKTLDIQNEETLASIRTVAELAGHCTAREPYQRPDMGHVVNVLSSLVELWKPSKPEADDEYGIDLDLTLPQALKKWQAFEGENPIDDGTSSSFLGSVDNTQNSIPFRPNGIPNSFTSSDGR